jgi:UrcA family protein
MVSHPNEAKEPIMKTQTTGLTNIVVMGAALTVGLLVGVAHGAEPGTEAPVKAVHYQDLNLNTNAGVQVLYKRIEGAAKQVCGGLEIRDLQGMRAHKACVQQAMDGAVAAVNNQMLTQRVAMAQVR